MAFSTPYTFTALELLTAAKMNAIQTNINAIWVGTTAGDTDYYTSSTTKSRVAIGTAYYTYRSTGSAPSWGVWAEKCVAYRSSVQTYTTGSTAAIQWNAELYDDGGWHDNSTNPERITVTTTGIYLPFVSIYWNKAAGGTGTFHLTAKVQVNGTDTANKLTVYEEIDAVTKQFTLGGIPIAMSATNYASVSFTQNSGGSGDILGAASNGERYSSFSLMRIG